MAEELALPEGWKPCVTTLRWVLHGVEKATIVPAVAMPASMERFTKEEIARGVGATAKDAFIQSLKGAIAQYENDTPEAVRDE